MKSLSAPIIFESIGWDRISITESALDAVEEMLLAAGVTVKELELTPYAKEFARFVGQPLYRGEYRTYGGEAEYCLLEKALEHFLSFKLIDPKPGMTGIDIGSCKSIAPQILRDRYGCRCYEQDLVYTHGVHGDQIGSSADAIPLPDGSIDFMMLHCTFEHFEGGADSGFVAECGRVLKPGGNVVILPLYLNANYCNITGEANSTKREKIAFDTDATFYCLIPEWQNRFGRHYSPEALLTRVLEPSVAAGLNCILYRVKNWEAIHPLLWLHWVLVLENPRLACAKKSLPVANAEPRRV